MIKNQLLDTIREMLKIKGNSPVEWEDKLGNFLSEELGFKISMLPKENKFLETFHIEIEKKYHRHEEDIKKCFPGYRQDMIYKAMIFLFAEKNKFLINTEKQKCKVTLHNFAEMFGVDRRTLGRYLEYIECEEEKFYKKNIKTQRYLLFENVIKDIFEKDQPA